MVVQILILKASDAAIVPSPCQGLADACRTYRDESEKTIENQKHYIIELNDLGVKKDNIISYQDDQIKWLQNNSNNYFYIGIAGVLGIAAGYIFQNERRR